MRIIFLVVAGVRHLFPPIPAYPVGVIDRLAAVPYPMPAFPLPRTARSMPYPDNPRKDSVPVRRHLPRGIYRDGMAARSESPPARASGSRSGRRNGSRK